MPLADDTSMACRGMRWWSEGGHRPVTHNSIAPPPAGCGPRSGPVPAARRDRRPDGRQRASGPPPGAREVPRPRPGGGSPAAARAQRRWWAPVGDAARTLGPGIVCG